MEGRFSSRLSFIMTAVGAAVGLGNVFRFPALAVSYGGGFILAYLSLLFLFGIPLFVLELSLGREGETSGGHRFARRVCGANAFIITTCYALLLALVLMAVFFTEEGGLLWRERLLLRPLFLLVCFGGVIFCFGDAERLGRISTVGVIFSCSVIFGLAICFISRAAHPFAFLQVEPSVFMRPRFWQDAAGQVFFSLSVMTGVLPAFGACLKKGENLPLCGIAVALIDLAVSLAATVIYVGVGGAEEGLLSAFSVYPVAFGRIFGGFGRGVTLLFFLGLSVLCLDSVVAYLKSVTVQFGLSGRGGALLVSAVSALFGVGLSLQRELPLLLFVDGRLTPLFTLLTGLVWWGPLRTFSRDKGRGWRLFSGVALPTAIILLLFLEIFT